MSICTKEVVNMGFFNKKSTTEESTETQELKRLLEEARVYRTMESYRPFL